MRLKNTTTESNIEMCRHVQMLGHSDYGVTELRTFAPRPLVAYVDNEDDIARLIERVLSRGYSPANCKTIRNNGFNCTKLGQCQVKAPMYLTHIFSI